MYWLDKNRRFSQCWQLCLYFTILSWCHFLYSMFYGSSEDVLPIRSLVTTNPPVCFCGFSPSATRPVNKACLITMHMTLKEHVCGLGGKGKPWPRTFTIHLEIYNDWLHSSLSIPAKAFPCSPAHLPHQELPNTT